MEDPLRRPRTGLLQSLIEAHRLTYPVGKMKTGVTVASCIILNADPEASQLKRMYPVVPTVGIVLGSATSV